ncbi:hypothetical protein IFO70_15615 [Phormidium tenue FACHB-886]|nr:hypothetical protein [Phormidium tenue FACHB-886]
MLEQELQDALKALVLMQAEVKRQRDAETLDTYVWDTYVWALLQAKQPQAGK